MKKGKTSVKHIPLNEDQETILDEILSDLESHEVVDPAITCYYEVKCKHCGKTIPHDLLHKWLKEINSKN